MKLIRLKITDPKGFRSLQPGFEVHFLRSGNANEVRLFNPYILAGPNSSGKSNVLEALAAIFYHLDCVHLRAVPDTFRWDEEENPHGFRAELSSPDAYELEYFIKDDDSKTGRAHVKIMKAKGQAPKFKRLNINDYESEDEEYEEEIEIKEFLPRYILGYSSGENEILSLPFFKMRFMHLDEYLDFLIKDQPYEHAEGRLTFLDRDFSQAVLLSNLLLQDKELLKIFDEVLGIQSLHRFRMVIRQWLPENSIDLGNMEIPDYRRRTLFRESEQEDGSQQKVLHLTASVSRVIDKLCCCATAYNSDNHGTLYLDYWVNEETRKAFRMYFGSALGLFQAFQILLTFNLYAVSRKLKQALYNSSSLYVSESVPILAADERVMCFDNLLIRKRLAVGSILCKSLSDGEHQFLHALGLSLLYKDENCLFLLDEPETHFNPEWRSRFISRLRDCFSMGHAMDTMREMLITTHSPFLISDSRPNYVLLFNKDPENGHIMVKRPEFNTLGASINKITMLAFNKSETIGGFAEQKLNELKRRFEAGEDPETIIKETNRTLGDSVEKVIFLNTVIQSLEGK